MEGRKAGRLEFTVFTSLHTVISNEMKLFALLILIGSATASLRGKISQQQTLSVDSAPEDGGVELLYIRHGESKGNGASVKASVRLLQYINTHTHTHTHWQHKRTNPRVEPSPFASVHKTAAVAALSRGNVFSAAYYGLQAADGKLTGVGKQQARDGVANGGDAKKAFICDQKANVCT